MNFTKNRWLEGSAWRNNIYLALSKQILLAMALLSICRLGFFFFNQTFFPEVTPGQLLKLMLGGLIFDLVTVLYVNLLFIVLIVLPLKQRFHPQYKLVIKYLYFITNGLALALNVSDFIYYRFTLRRSTA